MEDLPPLLPPAFSDSPTAQTKSQGLKQKSRLSGSSAFFPLIGREEETHSHPPQNQSIKNAAATSHGKFGLPTLSQASDATTVKAVKPGRKKLSLDIAVRVSREEPLSTAPQEPILPEEFLTALGVDRLDGKAVDEEFENLLRQKGMTPCYETSSTSKKGASDRLLCLHSLIASGSSGITYEVLAPNGTSFLYKIEKQSKLLTDPTNPGMAFWRHGDLSAAGLDLPHLVKATFYSLKVKLPDGREEKFFVPADKVKEFAQHLPPDAEVKLEGQLMEKAPGRTLAQLLEQGDISFHPDDDEGHFYTIVKAVTEFLSAAYNHNFVHRDLKPENILYHPTSKTVTIIDTGEASHLGARDIPADTEPSTSTKQRGTRQIMAPTMFEGKEYGSEVDFFSAAMLFLKLLQPEDVKIFNRTRLSGTVRDRFFGQNPQRFLSIYLDYLHFGSDEDDDSTTQDSSSFPLKASDSSDTSSPMMVEPSPSLPTTEEMLETHPPIKRLIELCFQASAGGSPEAQSMSRAALKELERLLG
ncbi:MAG: hypothetical protein FJ390_05145, partial [Verrucomicrobia bacterium]|nr:hypothetical protein [Verrucomicrobiota bacterium]